MRLRMGILGGVLAMVSLFAIQLAATSSASAAGQPWSDQSLSPDRRADLLEAQMWLPEKVNLITALAPCLEGAEGFVLGSARLGLPNILANGGGMGVSDV